MSLGDILKQFLGKEEKIGEKVKGALKLIASVTGITGDGKYELPSLDYLYDEEKMIEHIVRRATSFSPTEHDIKGITLEIHSKLEQELENLENYPDLNLMKKLSYGIDILDFTFAAYTLGESFFGDLLKKDLPDGYHLQKLDAALKIAFLFWIDRERPDEQYSFGYRFLKRLAVYEVVQALRKEAVALGEKVLDMTKLDERVRDYFSNELPERINEVREKISQNKLYQALAGLVERGQTRLTEIIELTTESSKYSSYLKELVGIHDFLKSTYEQIDEFFDKIPIKIGAEELVFEIPDMVPAYALATNLMIKEMLVYEILSDMGYVNGLHERYKSKQLEE